MTATDRRQSSGLTLRANFSWTFIGNVVNAASWFAMTIVLAKLGSPKDVGQFALGLATTAPIFMFATLRLRDVQATDSNREYSFGDYFALRMVTTVMALLVVAATVVVAGFSRELALVVLATAASKAIEAIADALYGLFMQQERLDRIAKSMIIKGPLSLFGLGFGFYLTRSVFWGVVGLAVARIMVLLIYDFRNAISSLHSSSAQVANSTPTDLLRPNWHARTLAKLVWLTLPLGFVTLLISFNVNIPRYFIEAHFGAYQLGIFAAVAAFQKTAPTIVQALGRSASPRLAKYYANDNAQSFRRLAFKMIEIAVVLGVVGVMVAMVAGRQILGILYGPEYVVPGLFVLVMIAAGIDYIATMLLFVLTSARYYRAQLPLQLLTTGVTFIACFFLIPSNGLQGAAMALIAGNVVRVAGGTAVAFHVQRALTKRSVSPERQALTLTAPDSC